MDKSTSGATSLQLSAEMSAYPMGFEEDESLRSIFIRQLTLKQLDRSVTASVIEESPKPAIPRVLIQYWHDMCAMPADVLACLDSWKVLKEEGFVFHLFNDASATAYISEKYGTQESKAFALCRHPAMRSDYFRMCFMLADGGFYVDADDVLLGDSWKVMFRNDRLKLQPLCYDILAGGMLPGLKIWNSDLPTEGRVFYVNNDPIVAPAGHPIMERALLRSTKILLGNDLSHEIQSTTGPGNLTASLAAHARELTIAGCNPDFELLHNWDTIAEMRWDLSYRNDSRNWRNVYGC